MNKDEREAKEARIQAHYDKPWGGSTPALPAGQPGELYLKNALDYMAAQSFHTRRALERIAAALEAKS